MGSHSKLSIREIQFDSWKNQVEDSFLILFSEEEKSVRRVTLPVEYEALLEEGEESPFFTVEYVTSVEVLIKRLDFLGFTLDACSKIFEVGKQDEIKDKRDSIEKLRQHKKVGDPEILIEHYLKRIELLENATPDSWLAALRETLTSPSDVNPSSLSELANFFRRQPMLPHDRFPYCFDDRCRFRFELEAVQTGRVVYDISELIDGDYCLPSDTLVAWSRDSVDARDRETLRLIVLTEGSTDKFVLESALKVLRPELREFVSFMDFAALRVEGGASFLANLVKSFAAAGIRDRIVAIFDNDTAGCLSQALVTKYQLPSNIRAIRYPDIDLAKAYPTQGPSGLVTMDVNGSAAGIELYLGRDVLEGTHKTLTPVQWKGFEPSLQRYQGEVLDKRGCFERYKEKLRRAEREGLDKSDSTWSDLDRILETICSEFQTSDAEFLLGAALGFKEAESE